MVKVLLTCNLARGSSWLLRHITRTASAQGWMIEILRLLIKASLLAAIERWTLIRVAA